MSIHSDPYFDEPGLRSPFDISDLIWVAAAALITLGVSPLLAVYLLLVN